MEHQEFAELFRLDITVVSHDRSKEIVFKRSPHRVKQDRNVIMWTRKRDLTDKVYVEESQFGELRVVKRVAWRDKTAINYRSELDVMGRVSKATELQNKQLFIHFMGWFPFKDHVCFVMEYCQFGDISQCYPNPLSEEESWCMCAQLLEGLAVLHDLGITHRDIKPQNVLVVQKVPIWVKIADFGISKRAGEGETELRTRIGTEGYMAPEVFGLLDDTRESSSYTSAVDIWSLGCLLYYSLTKQSPFSTFVSLQDYSKGRMTFPEGPLIEQNVGSSGRAFIQCLLTPSPEARPKASIELLTNWVISQTTCESTELPDPTEGVPDITTQSGKSKGTEVNIQTQSSSSHGTLLEPHEDHVLGMKSNLDPDEMDFYSSELWHVVKSTKSSNAGTERLRPLLESGANPSRLLNGYTALHLAAEQGPAEWVQVLLEYGADPRVRTPQSQETALHLSTCQGNFEIFAKKFWLLLNRRADVNAQNSDGDTTLHLAISRLGTVNAVETILTAGASTELKGRKGHTPLLYAIYLEQEEKATVLLKNHASANSRDNHGRTPLHLAVSSNKMSIEFVERLIKAGANINQEDMERHTRLYEATKRNRRDVMGLLLDHEANCNLGDSKLEARVKQLQSWRNIGKSLPWLFT